MGILGSKFAFEFDARSPPHSRAERSILREANDGGGSSINVARWDEKALNSVADHCAAARYIGGNDSPRARGRFR